MRWRRRFGSLVAVVLLWGCDRKAETQGGASAPALPLERGAAARVSRPGTTPLVVSADVIRSIAEAQGVSSTDARDRAISDALFAAEAIRQKKDSEHHLDIDSVLARRLAEDFLAQAKGQGPVADDEVEIITEKHWYDVARPEAVMTVTAVVQIPEDADPATVARAQAAAAAIHDAAQAISHEEKSTPAPPQPTNPRISDDKLTGALRAAVQALKIEGLAVKVEQELPMAKDNRAVMPVPFNERMPYEASYVTAALALSNRGEVSPVFRSKYGFHIVMLLARFPGVELSLEERRTRFEGDVYDMRARKIVDELLVRLHKEIDVEVERNADALLAEVRSKDLVMEVAAHAKGSSDARPPTEVPMPSPSPP